MRLGVTLGYWMPDPWDPIDLVLEAERLGYDSVWTAEAYGSDVVSPLCWIGARTSRIKLGTGILQISARTPACVAMTAATIDHLSGGRLILGVGVSGPQVVEGWYGQSLKLIMKPLRADIPIYLAAEGPKNVAMATEIADGWLPLYYSPYRPEVYAESLRNMKPGFQVACPVTVNVNDDLQLALAPVKWMLAFYIGGMGAKQKNFHADLVRRMGYADAADKVQQLFLEGKRAE